MKPVRMQYVQSGRWRAVWGVALLAIAVLVGSAGWHWLQRGGQTRDIDTRIAEIKVQIRRAQTPVVVAVDPRHTSTEQAIRHLRTDYNKVFAVVENLNEPGARLRALTLDVSSNTLRLEYDLDSVVKASAVTAALNAGYEARPWRLDSVAASNGSMAAGVVPTVPVVTFRGVWSVAVARL